MLSSVDGPDADQTEAEKAEPGDEHDEITIVTRQAQGDGNTHYEYDQFDEDCSVVTGKQNLREPVHPPCGVATRT